MSSKHTPTPWIRRGADTYRWQIETADAPKKAQVICRVTTPKGGAPVSDANADFIVTACNAHDDLVAAAKDLLLMHVNGSCHTCNHDGARCPQMKRLASTVSL